MNAPFPWQAAQWRHLWRVHQNGRMPHAILFHGNRGNGVPQFARRLAASLLCDKPSHEGTPCDVCKSCLLFQSGSHPEFFTLAPEGESKVIKIDQIRGMVQFVGLSAHYGHSKIVIIEPAEAMNRNAANSLLKTLEEPPPGTQFILVSHMPTLLPVTIRSRCQIIRFENPDKEIAKNWLAEQLKDSPMNIELLLMLADNAPHQALEIVRNKQYESRSMVMEDLERLAWGKTDPVEVASRWMNVGLEGILPWLWKLLEDLIKLQNAKRATGILNQDFENRLENLASSLKKLTVFAAYDQLKSYHQLIHSATNVTPLTLLEEFTIQWSVGND